MAFYLVIYYVIIIKQNIFHLQFYNCFIQRNETHHGFCNFIVYTLASSCIMFYMIVDCRIIIFWHYAARS